MTRSSPDTVGLEPCPVCKSRLVSLFERQEGLHVVSCENDDCHFGVEAFGSTVADAVRQWNTRTGAAQRECSPQPDRAELCWKAARAFRIWETSSRGQDLLAFFEQAGLMVAALTSTGSQAPAQAAWQPIETAPKDGTRILVCREDRFPKNTYVVRWLNDAWEIGPLADWIAYPTHWMPLPSGPVVTRPLRGGEK